MEEKFDPIFNVRSGNLHVD